MHTKASIHPEHTTALNIKALNTGAPNFIKQVQLVVKSHIYLNIVITCGINALL